MANTRFVDHLSPAQESRLAEFRDRWIKIALCTDPADRPAAEEGIRTAYRIAGLDPPRKIVWCGSPLSQGLTRAIVFGLVPSEVSDPVWASVRDSVGDSVSASVRASVGDSVWASVRDSVRASVWASVGASVGDTVRASVGDSVRASVGDSVRASVWASVRASVWTSVWDSVRTSVWDSVRTSVWTSVWDSVWTSVWDSVRTSVVTSVRDSVYGQHDANWLGFYDYFREVCELSEQTQKLCGLWQVACTAGWWLPHRNVCWVSERHDRVNRNTQGRLHCDGGPAISYPDGWGIHALNGVRVPEWLAEEKAERIDARKLTEINNAEVRREFVRKVGIDRVCYSLGAKTVDRSGTYELLMLDVGDGRRRPYLKMANPSVPEVWHIEGVHPDCRTVQEALNFRNGLRPDQIDDVNGADWAQQGDVVIRPRGAKTFKSRPTILT